MNQNILIVFILTTCLISCVDKRASTLESSTVSVEDLLDIPDITVDKSKLYFDRQKSLWSLNDQVYSGYAVSFYEDGNLKAKFGILNGRKQNQAIHWYADGHYKNITNYHDGKPQGDKKAWSPDTLHILLSHLKYVAGKPHGEQIKWYPTGEMFKKLNFNMGREEGLQQAFRKNGALFANYEAKNGRIFGLKKASLCFKLSEETIVSND